MRRHDQRGQGLVEFALIVPVILLVVVSVADLGLAYGRLHTLGYASREGARVGAALATGNAPADCSDADPAGVDAAIASAVQRILDSPSSGIDLPRVTGIHIFKADADGHQIGTANLWTYSASGTVVDGGSRISFVPPSSAAWPACSRKNGPLFDSLGVTVDYTYDFVTPLPAMIDAIAGGNLTLNLSETTVMSLNPTT